MLAVLAGVVAVLVAVPASGATASRRPGQTAHIYWSEPENGRGFSGSGVNTIWRARVTGTTVQRNFVPVPQYPGAVAVSGSYIYWTDQMAGAIGRAKLDGKDVKQNFIHAGAEALAVTARHIYWTGGSGSGTSVWRANLDGAHVQKLFSAGHGTSFGGIAVTRSYIYWSNRDRGTVGRADVNGTHVNPRFLSGLVAPNGLAVSRRNLFWASTNPSYTSSIGRSGLNGASVKKNFITGLVYPFAVAVADGYLYWADYDRGAIGRANLDGSHVQQNFIAAQVKHHWADPFYLAVGP